MDQSKINVVLLHGRFPERINGELIANIPLCDPNNDGNWMGWTKKQLEERGYSVTCPIITDVWRAPYQQWREELDKITIDENTVLVGLSAGGYALLRYLGESGLKVQKVILVAPGSKFNATEQDPLPSKQEFYSFEILPNLRDQIRDRVTIFVSNDGPEILKSVEFYQNILDAELIKLDDLGHFSFLINELPELLEEITK